MGLVGRFSYKFLVGGIFAVLIFGLVGSQQAMALVEPDIEIKKSVRPIAEGSFGSIISLEEGETGLFRIEANRVTEATISSVIVLDKLPSGLEFVSSSSPDDYNPDTGIWDVGDITEGSFRSLIIEFKVKTSTCGSDLKNTASLDPPDQDRTGDTNDSAFAIVRVQPSGELCPTGDGVGGHEPPTIGMNLRGNYQIVPDGICIDDQCWAVTENFHEDFELVQMLTSTHTISNKIYCSNGVNTCNHITLSGAPYGTDINSALWKVSVDKNFLGEITVTKDDPDGYLGDTTCTTQVQAEKYWFTSCTIDFNLGTDGGIMLGVQVWDTYGGVRNFYFNDGIEIIDTFGYPSVDTEFEPSLDVPRLCLSDDPDKRTSCTFAEKIQLEIERAEKLLEE